MQLQGFGAKTVTLRIFAGMMQYNLSSNKTLGLPSDVSIYSLCIRSKGRAVNGQDITTEQVRAFLYLKDTQGGLVVDGAPLATWLQKTTMSDEVVMPSLRADQIDWVNSYIQFNENSLLSLLDNTSIEFTVFYYRHVSGFELNTIQAENGNPVPRVQAANLVVESQANTSRFNLAFQSLVNIPEEAYVIGLKYWKDIRDQQNRLPVSSNQQDASFLNLKKQGTDLLIDQMPILTERPGNAGFSFFPLEPTKSKHIDWETSNIFLSDTALAEDDKVYIFTIYYQKAWR